MLQELVSVKAKKKIMSYKVTIKHRNVICMDFKCPNDHIFEIRDYSDAPLPECPKCNQISERVISAPHLGISMGTDPNSAQGNKWAKMHEAEAKRHNAGIDPNL